MSADNFHHQVEHQLKRQGKTYDFYDFVDSVAAANNGKVTVKNMQFTDFYKWKDHHSIHKMKNPSNDIKPYLSELVYVLAERGSYSIKYKNKFEGELQELDFLKKGSKNTISQIPQCNLKPVGIEGNIKLDIVKKLGPLMPDNRLKFWRELPTI